jgi:hypothetical protein
MLNSLQNGYFRFSIARINNKDINNWSNLPAQTPFRRLQIFHHSVKWLCLSHFTHTTINQRRARSRMNTLQIGIFRFPNTWIYCEYIGNRRNLCTWPPFRRQHFFRRSCYCSCQKPVQSNFALATLTWRCCGGVWRWVSIPTSLQYHNTQPRQRGARPHTVIVTWRETEMSCWTVLRQTSFSPNLAPIDFHVSGC